MALFANDRKPQVFGEQFSDPTPDNDSTCQLVDGSLLVPPDNRVIQIDDTCFREDALATQCLSPIAANSDDQNALDKSLVWKQFTYDCTTLCHDKDANVIDCPDPPQVL